MHPAAHDIRLLCTALDAIEKSARGLRWAKERPWRTASHIWEENGLAIIDLHDLNAGLTKKVIKAVEQVAGDLEAGGVVFITGVGRHSTGVPVLRRVVAGSLFRFENQHGWRHRDVGGGRLLLVVDEERVPAFWGKQTPSIAVWFFAIFFVALMWALDGPILVAVLLIVLALGYRMWRRSID